jgi:hypothetical protein
LLSNESGALLTIRVANRNTLVKLNFKKKKVNKVCCVGRAGNFMVILLMSKETIPVQSLRASTKINKCSSFFALKIFKYQIFYS